MTDTNKVDVEPVAHMNQHGVIHEAGYEWSESNELTPLHPASALAALRQENERLKEHAALRIDQVGESFRMENDTLRIQLAVVQDCVESLEAIKNRLTNDLNYMASLMNVRNTALAEAQAELAEWQHTNRIDALYRQLEAAQANAARYRNALVGMMACTLRADCPPDIYDAAEKALKGDVCT